MNLRKQIMQNQEMFDLFTKMAKEAGFEIAVIWYFQGSDDPDGWASNPIVIDGVIVQILCG